MYCIIMGDMIDSRKIEPADRDVYMQTLVHILEAVNYNYRAAICVPFKVIRGDAFEGILYTQYDSVDIILRIIRDLYNAKKIRIRINAVQGALTSMSMNSDECDGPAFHQAIDELEALKKTFKPLEKQKRSDRSLPPWFQVSLKSDSICDPLLSGLLNLLSSLTQTWSEKQTEIVWAMQELSSQQLVCQKLSVSPAVISKQLKAAKYDVFIQALQDIRQYFAFSETAALENDADDSDYTLYYSIGRRYAQALDYDQAITYCSSSLERASNQSVDPIFLIPIIHCLAHSYLAAADEPFGRNAEECFGKAAELISRSFSIQEGSQKRHPDYIRTFVLQGQLYLLKKEWQTSVDAFSKAAQLSEELFGAAHHLTDSCYVGLAEAKKQMKDYESAIYYYNQSLAYARTQQALDPVRYADALYRLGQMYVECRNYPEAFTKISEALAIYELQLRQNSNIVKKIKNELQEIQNHVIPH